MTLDDDLVESVDAAAKALQITRSAFTRAALQEALRRLETRQLEERHQLGYRKHPPRASEFTAWEDEQVWGDE